VTKYRCIYCGGETTLFMLGEPVCIACDERGSKPDCNQPPKPTPPGNDQAEAQLGREERRQDTR